MMLTYYHIGSSILNICDMKSIRCSKCGKFIAEIEYDAIVTLPKCGHCKPYAWERWQSTLYHKQIWQESKKRNLTI